jgi:DNA-binding XRE family transcriptional regulator
MKEIQLHNKERLQAMSTFIKGYRLNSGLSQLELSEVSEVHRNTIGRLESEIPKNITLLTVFEIADALELDISQVFHEIE